MALSYLSNPSKRINGTIKQQPSDFAVEEVMEDGSVLELGKTIERPSSGSKFVHFVLQKEDWSTAEAAREIAQRLYISPKRISYAGTKDRKALTTQLMGAFGVKKENVLALKARGLTVLGAWNSDEQVKMGMLSGNRFRIKVEGEPDGKTVQEIYSELNGKFPNYFGSQRFGGTRGNTHLIGEMLLRSDLRGAVESYLMEFEGETNSEAVEARKKLRGEMDYKKALEYFPRHLKMERLLLTGLAENSRDYAGALRRLPRQILLLFVHAFQSHLFNLSLSERIAGGLKPEEGEYSCGEKSGFPDLEKKQEQGWLAGRIIGYETETNGRENELLEKFNLRREDFKMRALPEVNSKGTYRTLLAPMKDFEYKEGVFSFSLPSGSYATSALREFIKELW